MPSKLPLGRTGSKHTKKKQKVKEDSTKNFPVVNLDMEAASDAGGTVEDVLDSLIGQVELAVAAWLQQHAELHERQWQLFARELAAFNACSFACRMLPYHAFWPTLRHAWEACLQLERDMQRGNPFLHCHLVCSECAELCRDCECGHCWPVHCPDCRKWCPAWRYACWDSGDCECLHIRKKVAGLL